jgi:hypothetical protein
LTSVKGFDTIDLIDRGRHDDRQNREEEHMATDIDTEEETEEMLSAKQAATKLGTDARTLRKFLRKKNGLVGQGQRWVIDPADISSLKKEFEAWNKGTGEKAPKPAPTSDEVLEEIAEAEEENDLLEDLDDLDELED